MQEAKKDGNPYDQLSDFLIPTLAELRTAVDSGTLTGEPESGLTLDVSLKYIERYIKKDTMVIGLLEPLYFLRRCLLASPGFESQLLKIELFIFFTSVGKVNVSELLAALSATDLDELIQQTQLYLTSETAAEVTRKRALISTIFVNSPQNFIMHTIENGFTGEIRKQEFNHPFFTFLLKLLLRYPLLFPYQIALLSSHILDTQLRAETEQVMEPVKTTYQGTFAESHGDWHLCDKAEWKLLRSFKERGVIVLTDSSGEGLIILKFFGKFTGLVLKNFTTETGQIIPQGVWVSPVSKELRENLRQTFDKNKLRVPFTNFNGDWVFMRGIKEAYFILEEGSSIDPEASFESVLAEANEIKNPPHNIFKAIYRYLTFTTNKHYRESKAERPN